MQNEQVKRIVVLGAGESGAGAAVLAKVKGFDVFVSDKGPIAPRYKEQLDRYEIPWEEGDHTLERILNADEAIKSPGIPEKAAVIQMLLKQGTPVISEIEFAGRYTSARMICITGSNGKTTTTLLTYHILKSAGLNVGLAGNVGKSLALQVATEEHDYYVIELSSFQLDNMYRFKANIAVLLNITPDHLDRYGYEMQNYVNAKFRITQNQTPDDAFIYWNDDPVIARELERLPLSARKFPFAEMSEPGVGAYSEDGELAVEAPGDPLRFPLEELPIRGTHNLFNSLAATLSAKLLKIQNPEIRAALADFRGVEHRLEYVASVKGVAYVNDSKATNVNSCWYALQSMKGRVVLILGGTDKGNDYSEIEPLVVEKVDGIVCLGVDNRKLLDFFGGKVARIEEARSMEEAVRRSADMARAGDTVLLSPCCASFDLFRNYEDRGDQFKACVRNL